ncbi:uncharacterized protein PITG_02984 [Phytophthora infestans T30-4]|uniref:Uncharacterized protein n=1 Tax=Phytophthora infestans (strain T30-4) TaxID=403677 RepID=D0MXN2_PHYIT|nr:uncharacterized protein PITG_02984 [Phytophthora infestans T30-4]EEY64395.1 conserved hypothetical protein [Phytophthora infestans T30-4]|eukprot:XP_002907831.1 conserved hypothetical protein [Phytophthora infestans T30-4]
MNAAQAPSQSKRPPEKGSFPLDHYGEGLMKPEELEKLGFHEEGMKKMWTEQTNEGRKEGEGFVAGLGIKKSRYEKK